MKRQWITIGGLIGATVVIGLLIFNEQASAGWALKNGLALNAAQTCQDGGYLGVATFHDPIEVEIVVAVVDTETVIFSDSFLPPPNPVPEIGYQNSAFYLLEWSGDELLPVGTTIDYNFGGTAELATVGDCLLNRSELAVGTAITYQGQLTDNGSAANGIYDLRFRLFDSATRGSQIGPDVTVETVAVEDGLFTVSLDFGEGVFAGDSRWLELAVKEDRVEAYATLNPRQPLTAVPYAHGLQMGATIAGSTLEGALTLANNLGDGLTIASGHNGLQIQQTRNDAIHIVSSERNGLHIDEVAVDGVAVTDAARYGLHVNQASTGLYIGGASGSSPFPSSAEGDGVYVASAERHGVHVLSAGEDSFRALSLEPHGRGLFAHMRATSGDPEGLMAVVNAPLGDALEVINTSGSPTANLIIGCDSINANGGCSNVAFRVRNNGNVTADGTFTGGGADYADMMTVAEEKTAYEPGDVLAIGPTGELVKAEGAYSTAVVGVYSTQPAFVGDPYGIVTDLKPNDEGYDPARASTAANRVPVALTGIVPVKVTAANGAIVPGDLLTSSDIAGVAMKAEPIQIQGVDIYPTGTIIGKALEGLANGEGIIQMLVMLR